MAGKSTERSRGYFLERESRVLETKMVFFLLIKIHETVNFGDH